MTASWPETTFTVTVTQQPAGTFHVHVTDQAGGQFATATAGELWTALEMALPYMRCAAQPDPSLGF